MNIQTELDINNYCFYLKNNEVKQGKVIRFDISFTEEKSLKISYVVKPHCNNYWEEKDNDIVMENLIAKTKELLLEKL